MSLPGTETRAPLTPELLRDFEALVDEKLTQERRKRRGAERLMRFALGLTVVALLLTLFMAWSLFSGGGARLAVSALKAGELHVVDGAGRIRGHWGVQEDGTTRLSLLDEQGTERLRLTLLRSGAQGVTLADSRGAGRVVLSLEGGEGSRLTFADGAGRPRTVLGLSSQEAATLIFADVEGAPRAAFGLEPDGRGTFVLPAEQSSAEAQPADTAAGLVN